MFLLTLTTGLLKAQTPTRLFLTRGSGVATSDALISVDLTGTLPSAGTVLANDIDDFIQPSDLLYDPATNFIYVVDDYNSVTGGGAGILRYLYNPSSNSVSGRTVLLGSSDQYSFRGLALDAANNRLYVSQGDANNVADALLVLNGVTGSSPTATTLVIGTAANGGFNNPTDLVYDPTNRYLYVSDQFINSGAILRYTLNTAGNAVSDRTVVIAAAGSGNVAPGGLALAQSTNTLYFTTFTSSTAVGDVSDALKTVNVGPGATFPGNPTTLKDGTNSSLTVPQDLALDRTGGFIYVSNAASSTGRVFRYTTTGANETVIVPATASSTYTGLALNGGFSTPNNPPTAANDTYTVAEDSGATIFNVLNNDSSAPDVGETLTVTSVTQPATGGTVTLISGVVRFTPAANFNGTTTFTYTISDGNGGTATATVTVTVTAVNDPPTATNDTFTVAEDSPATVLNVLTNDSSAPDTGETLTVTTVTQPATGGTVTLTGGVVRFTPAANFNGTATFTYTISDGNGGTATASVTITVTPVNDPPTANNDAVSVNQNSGATVVNVLTNDSSAPDTGEALTVTSVTQPATGGTVTLTGGVVRFTPTTNFSGITTFTYTISDGNGGTATATVTVTVTDNIAPTVVIASSAGTSGGSTSTSPIPFTLTFSESVTGLVSGEVTVSNGTLNDFAGGGTTYTFNVTPAANGLVSINVAANVAQDASGNGNTAATQFTITYSQPVTAAPVITSPPNGTLTNSATITVAGTAPANSLVRVYNASNNTVIATQQLTAGATSWNIGISLTLNTTNIVYATAQLSAQAESTASTSLTINQDATAPVINSVSVPANGFYRAGQNLNFLVRFSETVLVTGTPQLLLTIGSTARQASYVSGSGTNELTFSYTVQNGEQDTDGITLASALTPNDGTIRDAATNNATLTLNNVASTTAVLVDAITPTVSISSSAGASGATTSTSPIPVTVTFSENVTNFIASDVTVSNGTLSDFAGSGSTYSFNVTPSANGLVTINIGNNAAQDGAGNPNTAAAPFSINYLPGPTITGFNAINATICTGGVVGFTATLGNVGSGYTYTLADGQNAISGDGTGTAFSQSITVNTSGTRNFTLVVVSNGLSSSATTSVTVNPVPTPTLVASGTLTCAQTSVTLTAGGGTTYQFSGPGSIIQSGNTAIVNAAGTYSVTVSSGSGCSSTTAVTVDQNINVPSVNITPTSATLTCATPTATLSANGSGTYRWNTGASTSIISVTSAGTYSVTLTAANGCIATAMAQVVQDNNVPSASIAPTSATLTCANPSATLTASGGSTYRWNTGATTSSISANAAGIYSVTVTGANGCTSIATAQVGQDTDLPSVNITPASATLTCANPSATLTASGNGTYLWNTGATTPSISVSLAGTYSVTLTGTNGCAAVALAQVGQDNAVPAPGLQASALSTVNQPISVTASGCSGTLSWQVLGGTGQASGNIYTLTTPGTYTLTATCTVGTCTSPPAPALLLTIQAPNTNFAITSVNMVNCFQINPGKGQYSVQFTPRYAGSNGNPISFSVANELAPTTQPAPYTLNLYQDNPTITLVANQAGNGEARYVYNWLASCSTGSSPNQPPTTVGISAQTATVNQPYQLNLSGYFTDPEGQPLTYSAQGLPPGLSVTGNLISGTPSQTGTFGVSITAIDPGNLSVNTTFNLTVQTQPTQPIAFAIVGVSSVSCEVLKADQRRVRFNPQYSGLNGQSVTFRVVNELPATTQPGPYSLDLYTDNPVIELRATQAGTAGEVSFSYNWLAACNSTPPVNAAPTVTQSIPNQVGVVGQAFSYNIPANTFTDPNGDALVLSASGLPAGLNLSGSVISGTPSVSGVSTVFITATDPGGLSVSTSFVLTINQVTVPPTGAFAITGVQLLNCQTISAQQRLIRFTPQYSGLNGQPISFSVVNELAPTTAGGPYELRLYTDNPVIVLKATQVGTAGEATFSYNWLAACNAPTRQSAENLPELNVQVLGNPVVGEWVEVLVMGAGQQTLHATIINQRGVPVDTWQRESASDQEQIRLRVGSSGGVYLLKVETPSQRQTVKLLKH
ncbi:Ig-like domain-containing protein [Spirosoma flavus]